MSPPNHGPARDYLRAVDPVLGGLVERFGDCTLGQSPPALNLVTLLARSIVYQQISLAAASAVYQRFLALYPEGQPTAELLAATPPETLKAIGLSRQKVAYMQDLAAHGNNYLPTLAEMSAWSDPEILACLTQIKGIGRWSVEMLLMFQLHRWDILPLADVGLQVAVRDCYGLPEKPTPKVLAALGEPWRPYRSIATWYLWCSRDGPNTQFLSHW
jgi:DNA-3-methyladenine glycosylase II